LVIELEQAPIYRSISASTAATSVGYVYTAEVYPTDVRNVGVGCCSSFAMFGALLSPSLAILEDYVWWFPSLFNGVIGKSKRTFKNKL